MTIEFQGWPKTPRLNRDMIITEKIDGTNAAIIIEDRGTAMFPDHLNLEPGAISSVLVDGKEFQVAAQSRKKLLQLGQDNFGFALWVATHAEELVRALGPGRHFGEWWGHGIQRGYDLLKGQRAFSLFNTHRYADVDLILGDGTALTTVPVLYQGPFHSDYVEQTLEALLVDGSSAAPGYERPEGVVVFHSASGHVYKVLAENDDLPKGEA